MQTLEKCNVYATAPEMWQAGQVVLRRFDDGTSPARRAQKILRAIDVQTGRDCVGTAADGPADSWGGALSTAGGLVFFGDDGGAFAAVDATTGERLWQFQANIPWKASPMTYVFDGRQFVAVAAGSTIIAFALP